jgi:hypothetical protein
MKRALLTSVALLSALIAPALGSGGAHSASQPTAKTFIKLAMQSSAGKTWGLSLSFPKKPGTIKCVIYGGGPAPGIRVRGWCSTTVLRSSTESATVRFIERWNARRFRGPGAGRRSHLSHTYDLKVSTKAAGGDHLVKRRSYGDFPPQQVM